MKVLHVNDHLTLKGGIEVYLLDLFPLLEQAGVEVVVAHGFEADHAVPFARHVPCIAKPSEDPGKTRQVVRALLEQEKPDLVHLHSIQNLEVIKTCLSQVPTVITGHDYRIICPAGNLYYRKTKKICERSAGLGCLPVTLLNRCMTPRPHLAWTYLKRSMTQIKQAQHFAHVILPSEYTRRRFLEAGFPSERTTAIPYFCPVEPAEKPRTLPEKPRITFVGRSAVYKGTHTFVEMLARLPGSVEGQMVGNFSEAERRELLALAAGLGCEDRLLFEPWAGREGIPGIYKGTTVFVFPTLMAETLGIVGLEAMAYGVPVVSSDIGAVSEWLKDGVNGFVFPPGDAAGGADKINRLLSDQGLLQQFGIEGLNTIQEKFLPGQHLERLLSVYQRALASPVKE